MRQAQVDHIVIGARGASAVRRYLGSVSSQVVAEASCNVTVVRTRGQSLSVTCGADKHKHPSWFQT